MEMVITPDWLRNKHKTEPELEVEAGFPVEHLSSLAMFLPPSVVDCASDDENAQELHQAFGHFVRQLRLSANLSVESLAERARVEAVHIESIESDITFSAPPRTVHNLANVFEIPAKKMMVISGVADTRDNPLAEEAVRFAAKSIGVSSLNSDEQELLSAFIKYVVEA